MNTKDSAINDCAKSEIVKNFTTPAPNVTAAVFTLTFIVKTIDLGNLTGLVVASDKSDTVWIADLECEEE